MVAQAMNGDAMGLPSLGLDGNQGDMMTDPSWMADLSDMDWVSRLTPIAFHLLVCHLTLTILLVSDILMSRLHTVRQPA